MAEATASRVRPAHSSQRRPDRAPSDRLSSDRRVPAPRLHPLAQMFRQRWSARETHPPRSRPPPYRPFLWFFFLELVSLFHWFSFWSWSIGRVSCTDRIDCMCLMPFLIWLNGLCFPFGLAWYHPTTESWWHDATPCLPLFIGPTYRHLLCGTGGHYFSISSSFRHISAASYDALRVLWFIDGSALSRGNPFGLDGASLRRSDH